MEEEVVYLRRECENLKKSLDWEKRQTLKIKKRINEQKKLYADTLQNIFQIIEICSDVGISNLINFRDTLIFLR